jgi:hypothetical protein
MARRRSGVRTPKEKPTFREASEQLKEMAARIIDKYHSHLGEANIKYLVRTGKWEIRGKTIYGKASKASSQVKYVSGGFDFIVTINKDVWDANTSAEKREAVLDHVLTYCGRGEDDKVTGDPKWTINQPTVVDFPSVIRRHGLWTESLQSMFKAKEDYEQMQIIPFEKAKEKEKKTGTEN